MSAQTNQRIDGRWLWDSLTRMAEIGEKQAQLLTGKNLAHFATLRADGSPHLTVTWIDWDGENVLVNTAVGRAKEGHLRRDPRAAGVENVARLRFRDAHRGPGC